MGPLDLQLYIVHYNLFICLLTHYTEKHIHNECIDKDFTHTHTHTHVLASKKQNSTRKRTNKKKGWTRNEWKLTGSAR